MQTNWCGILLKMKNINKKIKIHFIGIGGIGMSGIAELMRSIGYTVQGSDINESENIYVKVRSTGKLIKSKIKKNINHEAEIFLEDKEEGVSPGQACVFYSKDSIGDKVLGGGWIVSASSNY